MPTEPITPSEDLATFLENLRIESMRRPGMSAGPTMIVRTLDAAGSLGLSAEQTAIVLIRRIVAANADLLDSIVRAYSEHVGIQSRET